MICPKCGQLCKDICVCGWKLSSAPSQSWIIQHCATPGCDVAIRARAGQQEAIPVCQWCMNNTAYNATQGNAYNAQV